MVKKNSDNNIRLFIRFLKENGVYEVYNSYTSNNIKKVFNNVDLCQLIAASCDDKGWAWSNTKEGNYFWFNIHAKYLIYLFDNSNKIDKFNSIKSTLRLETRLIVHVSCIDMCLKDILRRNLKTLERL